VVHFNQHIGIGLTHFLGWSDAVTQTGARVVHSQLRVWVWIMGCCMFEICNGQRWIFAGFLLTARTWVIYLAMKAHVLPKADCLFNWHQLNAAWFVLTIATLKYVRWAM